jgi:site-specific DNA recombinase
MSNAAIYARVSSARQKEQQTIDSQTAALRAQAEQLGVEVPAGWEFCDDGHSGATLVRPGLEKLRDLVAQVPVETVLVYAPDRLARKYAYQALLIEEFAKHGTSVVFVKGPSSDTPEDALLVQFQGMIAEYERAQIIERTRRGKSHRARQGTVNVLSGAPFGYRYVRKSEHADATYEVLPHEAAAVAELFRRYVEDGVAIAELARWLTATEVPTRTGKTRWDRSTVWAMLRNPAYAGRASFGKTMRTSDQPGLNRTARLAGRSTPKSYSVTVRDRADWVEIPVPALITEDTWQRAQLRLVDNKRFAARSSKVPSLLQGLAACSGCGYAYYRSHTTTSAGNKIYYYRCLGSDAYRYEHGAVCDSKPVRTDYLDKAVWDHIGGLLADPQLVRSEIDRRLDELRTADPTTAQQQRLEQALAKTTAALTRLINAYQEELISLDELRARTPELRSREKSLRTQLDAVANQLIDREAYLALAENLETFLARLRDNTEHANTREQQRVLRLLVREVLIGPEHVTIRHCIPTRGGTTTPTMEATDEDSDKEEDPSSHLRWRSHLAVVGQHLPARLRSGLGRARHRRTGPLRG